MMPTTWSSKALLVLMLLLNNSGSSSYCLAFVQRAHHHRRLHYSTFVASSIRPLARYKPISAQAFDSTCDDDDESRPRENQRHETLESLADKLYQIAQTNSQSAAAAAAAEDNDTKPISQSCRLSLLRTRLDNLTLNRTKLGPSTIVNAGRGLFCACDSNEGDLLTCYPGDALVTAPGPATDGSAADGASGRTEYAVLWGEHVRPSDRTEGRLREYMLHARDDRGVMGLPSIDADAGYLGHFVNDGGRLLSQGGFTDYLLESFESANARWDDVQDGSHMVLIATRDLVEGEEIFVTYGPEYWMEQPDFVDDGGSIYGEDEDD